jgi:hypothetical protein
MGQFSRFRFLPGRERTFTIPHDQKTVKDDATAAVGLDGTAITIGLLASKRRR